MEVHAGSGLADLQGHRLCGRKRLNTEVTEERRRARRRCGRDRFGRGLAGSIYLMRARRRTGARRARRRLASRLRRYWRGKDRGGREECRRGRRCAEIRVRASGRRFHPGRNRCLRSRCANPTLEVRAGVRGFFKQLLVAKLEGLVDGRGGIEAFQNRMAIAAGRDIAEHGNVREPAKFGVDFREGVRCVLLDDGLILGEALERFHGHSRRVVNWHDNLYSLGRQ